MEPTSRRIVRFGPFEADLVAGELRKDGVPVKIQEQPMRVLAALLDRAGALVERDELRERVWPGVQSLDFEHGINVAVRKLRTALNDSADEPQYIQTLPKKGYRFIGSVEVEVELEPKVAAAPPDTTPEPGPAPAVRVEEPPRTQRKPFARFAVAAAIAAVALGIAGAYMWRRPAPMRSSVLFSATGRISDLALSPDGKTVAFTLDDRVHEPKIFVTIPGAGNPRRLTDDPDPTLGETKPHWIGGGRIAFLSVSVPRAIYVVPETGGTPSKLIEIRGNQGYSWMPDGTSLVVSRRAPSGRFGLYSVNTKDGTTRQISSPADEGHGEPGPTNPTGLGDVSPVVSPDGERVAFIRRLSATKTLMFMPTAGGSETALFSTVDQLSVYAWSADGKSIIGNTVSEGGLSSFVRIRVPDGERSPLALTGAGTDAGPLAIAAASDRLAFAVNMSRSKLWRYDLDSKEPPRVVAQSDGGQAGPAISPDGERLAFASTSSGTWEIYVQGKNDKFPVRMTSFGRGETGSPTWSPDGRQIAFDARPDGRPHIYVVNSDGGAPRRLTDETADSVLPRWSRDGASIYYTQRKSNSGNEIRKIAASGGASSVVTSGDVFGNLPSPDGKWLFVGHASGPGLEAFPLAGGQAYSLDDQMIVGRLAIAASGIYAVGNYADGVAPLLHHAFGPGPGKRLLTIQGRPFAPAIAVSPDEKYALVSQTGEYETKIILVDNFR